MPACPLCCAKRVSQFYGDRRRDYLQCLQCWLVFVPYDQYITAEEEKAEYDLHCNSSDDEGYRGFLSRITSPLQDRLNVNAKGLDFGCGPGPTLSIMMAEKGWPMALYDPFYADNVSVLAEAYDFITLTEVIEHIHQPNYWLSLLWRRLSISGYLAVMTKRLLHKNAFTTWHYKNDPTHVCFYSEATFHYLAHCWQAQIDYVDKDVVLLKKTQKESGPLYVE